MGSTMPRVVWLGVLFGASCAFSQEGLDPGSGGETPATPSGAMAEPAGAAPSAPSIMRFHKVEANRLSVGTLFAHKVQAKNGTVTSAGPPLAPAELEGQTGNDDLEVPELSVDVLYAHEVDAKVITVRQLHASEVKIGKDQGSDD